MSDLTDNERRLSSELALANNALYEVRLERDRLLADAQSMTALIERLQAPAISSMSTDLSVGRIAEWAGGHPSNPVTRDGVYMAQELQRRRAEQAAGREHVERVVSEVIKEYIVDRPIVDDSCPWDVRAIASRAADRLSVPVHPDVANADVGYIRTDGGMSFAVDIGVPTSPDRLSVPVLSEEEREALAGLRRYVRASTGMDSYPDPRDAASALPVPAAWVNAIDRLIAAGKP